tara:strand:+ start:607 stop:1038 length:432 start_codon:yes stop_codon:yes gene_type:complete
MPFLTTGMILTSDVVSREVISGTTGTIYRLLSGISEFDLEHVNQLLEELDLNKKIEIVESLFDNNRYEPTKKTFNIALNNLHEISEKISLELKEIKKDIEYTKTLYFKQFRSHKYMKNLENLKKHSKILDNRLDLVIKLSDMN